jgi:predicted transcriptional regulator
VTKDGRPQKLSDDKLLKVIHDAVEAGETDLLEGGVPAEVIVDRVPLYKSTVEKHLRRLVDDGLLVRVRGADPASYRPRDSYLPSTEETFTPDS